MLLSYEEILQTIDFGKRMFFNQYIHLQADRSHLMKIFNALFTILYTFYFRNYVVYSFELSFNFYVSVIGADKNCCGQLDRNTNLQVVCGCLATNDSLH